MESRHDEAASDCGWGWIGGKSLADAFGPKKCQNLGTGITATRESMDPKAEDPSIWPSQRVGEPHWPECGLERQWFRMACRWRPD